MVGTAVGQVQSVGAFARKTAADWGSDVRRSRLSGIFGHLFESFVSVRLHTRRTVVPLSHAYSPRRFGATPTMGGVRVTCG